MLLIYIGSWWPDAISRHYNNNNNNKNKNNNKTLKETLIWKNREKNFAQNICYKCDMLFMKKILFEKNYYFISHLHNYIL